MKLVSSEYRICADCDGTMRKMPRLNNIWMCERCSGVNYRLPEEWGENTSGTRGRQHIVQRRNERRIVTNMASNKKHKIEHIIKTGVNGRGALP